MYPTTACTACEKVLLDFITEKRVNDAVFPPSQHENSRDEKGKPLPLPLCDLSCPRGTIHKAYTVQSDISQTLRLSLCEMAEKLHV